MWVEKEEGRVEVAREKKMGEVKGRKGGGEIRIRR
jgi:hypothetical protein